VFPPARLAAGEATTSASTRGGSGFRSSRRATRFGRGAVSDGVAMHSARAAHPHPRGAAPIRCSARKPAPRVEGAGVAEPYRGPPLGLGPPVEPGSGAFAALCPGAPEDEPIGPARVDARGEERPARARPRSAQLHRPGSAPTLGLRRSALADRLGGGARGAAEPAHEIATGFDTSGGRPVPVDRCGSADPGNRPVSLSRDLPRLLLRRDRRGRPAARPVAGGRCRRADRPDR